ncbi:MAG: hypothetical protein JNL62_25725 [Bryobacterales bacterium]|nr:hypothetical protein [Bryobacterales bacterium]
MLFTLEALNAKRGDSLLLHYGDPESPNILVIDGGPEGVYKESLRPRLAQIVKKFNKSVDDPLPIEMVMVSHIDDDHINGILDWFGELKKAEDDEGHAFQIQTLWFNSFDDVAGNGAKEMESQVASVASSMFRQDTKAAEHTQAIVASVGQGRKLRTLSDNLAIGRNAEFNGGMVMAAEAGKTLVKLDGGLRLTVLAPNKKRLEDLNKEWEKSIKPKKNAALTAAFVDKSVANLSSIVVLAELGSNAAKKSVLLTGDARGDDMMKAVEEAELLQDGKMKVDIFKLPHHGSNRNSAIELFQSILADHYIISADGEHENPDREVIEWIAEARGKEPYTIHITNEKLFDSKKQLDVGALVRQTITATAAQAPKRKVAFRKEDKLSMKVDLMDPLPY